MVGLGDAAHARGGALADVSEQARAVARLGPLVGRLGARAHREGLQHRVDRLADRPHLCVRAEVARAANAARAGHHHARHRLAEGDGEVGVGLVVAKLDVERRRELFDPRVLELQCLELGADDGPLDAAGGRHHAARALVQGVQRLEVVGEPRAQVLGLADVQHSAGVVAKSVHAGRCRDLASARPPVVARDHDQASTTSSAGSSSRRKDAVWLPSTRATSSGVPVATIVPPPEPPSGPRSIR